MNDNAEEGIARTQTAAAQAQGANGLQKYHKWNIANLNERILVFILAIAIVGLFVLWITVKSVLVFYISFAGVVLLIALWGIARIKRIKRIKEERERQAKTWQAQ